MGVYQQVKKENNFQASDLNNGRRKISVAFPLIDGVVHFKMQPVDSLGQLMRYWTNNPTAELVGRQSHYRYGSVVLKPDDAAGLYGEIGAVAKTRSAFLRRRLASLCGVGNRYSGSGNTRKSKNRWREIPN